MMLPVNCIPCPAPVRHAARHVAHHVHHRVFRPVGRRVHHVAHHVVHHAPRIVAYGCCAAAVGGLGGALVAPPGGYFVPPAIAEAPPVGGYGGTAQGWPEMPTYSGLGGGVAIGGGGAVMIPVYNKMPTPQLLDTRPVVFPRKPPTSVPEPSSVAVFLLPGLWVLWARRRMRA
jgi:hypothetical protein